MGGCKFKRGVENLMNDTPPKRVFDPPSYGTFSTPLRCQCSVFPVQKSTTEQTRSSLEGSNNFRESAFSGTFSSPHTFCTPPYHGSTWDFLGSWDRNSNTNRHSNTANIQTFCTSGRGNFPDKNQRFRKGVGGRGLATKNSPPELCSPTHKGA